MEPWLPARAAWHDVSFYSRSLARDETYRVYEPAEVAPGERLPVLYLLHGNGGSYRDWPHSEAIPELAASGYLIVMPEGRDGYYVNAARNHLARYEDYVTSDLVADVDGRFSTIASRPGRAIAGVSMGGFGAVVLALKHPASYSFAGSLSGPLDAPERHFSFRRLGQSIAYFSIFGAAGSASSRERDPFILARSADGTRMPYLFLSCGQQEPLLGPNVRFDALLSLRNIAHTFQTMPGGHDWKQWNEEIPALLQALKKKVPSPRGLAQARYDLH